MKDDVKSVLLGEDDFERDDNNKIISKHRRNILVALKLSGIRLSYNEFSDEMLIEGLADYKLLDDPALIRLWFLISESYHFLPPKDFFYDALSDLARINKFHPVRDYLNGLRVDGVRRLLDNWLTIYAGVKDTPYTRAVGRLILIAAVRRVRQPGCKFDEMLVLEGPQGNLKSMLLSTIAVREDWFTDDLPLHADSKKLIEQLRGRWIVEASEMVGYKKTDIEHLKSLLSRTRDRARMSYDRAITDMPRHSVIAGTTNDAKYLRDMTGNRRFWPVTIGTLNIEGLVRDRDQLWAEAAAAEATGESIRLDKSLWAEAAREQDQRLEDDPWKEIIEEVLGDMTGKVLKADVREIINRPSGQLTSFDTKRLNTAMRSLGWKDENKLRFGGDPVACWYRGEPSEGNKQLVTILVKVTLVDGKRVVKAQYSQAKEDHDPRTESEKEPL